jgi:hypothetical protein
MDIYLILLDLVVHRREHKGRKGIKIRHGFFSMPSSLSAVKLLFTQRSKIAEIAENAPD